MDHAILPLLLLVVLLLHDPAAAHAQARPVPPPPQAPPLPTSRPVVGRLERLERASGPERRPRSRASPPRPPWPSLADVPEGVPIAPLYGPGPDYAPPLSSRPRSRAGVASRPPPLADAPEGVPVAPLYGPGPDYAPPLSSRPRAGGTSRPAVP